MSKNKWNSLSNSPQKTKKEDNYRPKTFTGESFQIPNERINILSDIKGEIKPILQKLFQKIQKENLSKLFYEARTTMIPKLDKTLKNQTRSLGTQMQTT